MPVTRTRPISLLAICLATSTLCAHARAAEHITLRNGFELDCTRQEISGDRVRLYLVPSPGASPSSTNYIEVASSQVLRTESIADPAPPTTPAPAAPQTAVTKDDTRKLTGAELHQMLASAGTEHNVDADLLASVVLAESHGQVHAVSRTGARGLMQLMPSTAADLGVTDSFAPEQNIRGGTAYLDALLTRFHNNLALALAAYNAGPAAVDRYHGVPPFAETRQYVSRVIREFNRRKRSSVSSLAAAEPEVARSPVPLTRPECSTWNHCP